MGLTIANNLKNLGKIYSKNKNLPKIVTMCRNAGTRLKLQHLNRQKLQNKQH